MTRVLSPANQITLLRLIFVPIFVSLVVGRHYDWALVVLFAAALSDGADGLVARKLHQQTALGIALDPIADKVLMTAAYLALSFRGGLPWWLTIAVITRDAGILLTAALISLVAGYRPFPPTFLGKSSTVAQVVAVFLGLALLAHVPLVGRGLVRVSIYVAAAFTVASGIHYLIVARHRFASAPED
ncbi:MAG TPA: CDP-alcohol phosphatidyltransferase family protein [Terriglobia bacterium]|nr:CDP-alcohol phosphatidyltransferase family protein [Terriglobia bacterium]